MIYATSYMPVKDSQDSRGTELIRQHDKGDFCRLLYMITAR